MTHTVQAGDTLYRIAQQYKVSVSAIKTTNALRSDALQLGQRLIIPSNNSTTSNTNSTTVYTVKSGDTLSKIARKYNTTVANIKQLNGLYSDTLQLGQQLKIPSTGSTTSGGGTQSSTNSSVILDTYIVKSGDSLFKIAQKFDISVAFLKMINNLTSNALSVGQRLKVPSGVSEAIDLPEEGEVIQHSVSKGDTLTVLAWKFDTSVQSIKALNNLKTDVLQLGQLLLIRRGDSTQTDNSNNTSEQTGTDSSSSTTTTTSQQFYTVQAGDTLWKVAKKFDTSTDKLISLNNLKTTGLQIGQQLIVGTQTSIGGSTNTTIDKEDLVFQFTHNIQATVGKGGGNWATDVKTIQQRLTQIGFLAPAAFNNEKPASVSGKIADWRLPQTLAAIERFQQEVMGATEPDDLIKPEAHSLMFLNTAVARPGSQSLSAIQKARSTYHLKANNGQGILKDGLKGPVGENSFDNYAEDVQKIQTILVQTGFLVAAHGETPSGTAKITPYKLKRTISALKQFQKYKVEWWLKRPEMIGNIQFTRGVVYPNDLTYHLLTNYTQYQLTFPDVNNPAKRNIAEFTNYPKSWSTIDVNGISFAGNVLPDSLSLKEYEQLGLSKVTAKALQYVSEHEGKFDALNTYDKAILSYGFIQFAGGTGGLAPMLALMKHKQPSTFQKRFQNQGVDVEYSIQKGEIKRAQLVVADKDTGKLLRRTAAETYIKNNVDLYGIFIQAAYDVNVQKAQIDSAKRKYVVPALQILLNFNMPVLHLLDVNKRTVVKTFVGAKADQYRQTAEYSVRKGAGRIKGSTLDIVDVPMTEIIRSEMGLTVLIDLTVNQWIHVTRDQFTSAIKKVAAADSLDTLAKLKGISDWKVLHYIVQDAVVLASFRTKNIMDNSGLSATK